MRQKRRPKLSGLFWNVNGRDDCAPLVAAMIKTYGVDLVVLAEYDLADKALLDEIARCGVTRYRVDALTVPRLRIFSRLPSVIPVFDDGHLSIRRIHLGGRRGGGAPSVELLVAAAHLPSKLYYKTEDQTAYAVQYASDIIEAEKRTGITRTLLVGDLNMDPFEQGVVQHNAFHGIMNRQDAARQRSRTIHKRTREFFYNPSWRLFTNGRLTPSGTYWYGESGQAAQFWHVFDQVLIRPSLIDAFEENRFGVVSLVGKQSLLRAGTGRPGASDHLPIRFALSF